MIRVLLLLVFAVFSEAEDDGLPTAAWPRTSKLAYNYQAETLMTDYLGANSPRSSVRIMMKVSVTNAAVLRDQGQLLQVAVSEPRIGQDGQQIALDGPPPLTAALFVTKAGAIEHLYVASEESTFWINVYKGLGSLIQSRAIAGEIEGVDASGECRNHFRQKGENLVERTKRRCAPMELSDEIHSHGEGKKVVRTRNGRTLLRFRGGDNILESAEGSDTVVITVPVAGQSGPSAIAFESSQSLKLQSVAQHRSEGNGEEDEEKTVERLGGAVKMRLTTLASEEELRPRVTTKQLRKVLEQHRAALSGEDGSKTETVEAFKTLLETVRGVRDARVILKLLNDDDLIDLTPAILDASVICATGPCTNVVLRRLRLNDTDNTEEQERLLTGLSYMVEPDEATLIYLLEQAQQLPPLESTDELDGSRAQLWATLGAMVGKFRLSPTGKYSKVTTDVIGFLEKQLEIKAAQEDVILAILTALQNVGEAPESSNIILGFLVNSKVSHRVHCAAIDTMMIVGLPDHARGLARSRALRLVQSRPFPVDVTTRVRSLDFLLSLHPTMAQVVAAARAFKTSSHLRDGFVNRFSSWCRRESREDLWELVLTRVPDLLQYPGSSVQPPNAHISTFLSGDSSKGEVSGLSAVDLTTDTDGSVRRSDSSAYLKLADSSHFPLYRLVLYTDGLNTAANSEGESAADVTAGIVLSILGVSIRPYRFFSGYSGLMSAIWNAPTTPTPFLRLNMAFIDAQHVIDLQNGFSIRFVASGLASIDLSGMMSISLWNQKAEGQMKTTAAIGLSVSAELISSRLSARLTKDGTGTFSMNFDANSQFSTLPPKMCFLASFPDTEMIWKVQKIFGSDKDQMKGRRLIPGSTLSLGRSNEQSCALILKDG